MKIIIGNAGNDSIALLQWAINQALPECYWVTVDTGFAAPGWLERVVEVDNYAKAHGVTPVRLCSAPNFSELALQKNNFPDIKFHWCANTLKGLPILDWLDEVDPTAESTVLLAKRRGEAKDSVELPEKIIEHELYNDRTVWHPLYQHSLAERNDLIGQSGFEVIATRSLECEPCIYQQARDFKQMSPEAIARLAVLEAKVGRPMFSGQAYGNCGNIQALLDALNEGTLVLRDADTGNGERDIYYSGCGSEFGCGL